MLISFRDMVRLAIKGVSFKYEQWKLSTSNYVEITTALGKVKGVQRHTVWGDTYYSFERLPYAKPPLGELRFKAPAPPEAWQGVLDCTQPAEKAMQANEVFKYFGSEDCLYLNVYTNNIKPEKPRPVMIWIHGGAFQIGEATREFHSPDFFMSKDVILITVAYRLGAFGFLSLDDPAVDVPGNAGIKDQVMAVKWVQQNISSFGGDPNNVTLFGESAGGSGAHFCLLTDETKGLVHKAIIMSGSALCPWALPPKFESTYRLAKKLNYEGPENDSDIFKFIQQTPAPDIVKAANRIVRRFERQNNRILFGFCPVVEPYVTKQCVLPKDPYELMQNAWSNEIPILTGATSFEGLLFYRESKRDKDLLDISQNCKNLLPPNLQVDRDCAEAEKAAENLKKAYFGDQEISPENLLTFLEVQSYREFWHPIYRTVMSRLRNGTAPSYVYRFDLDSKEGNWVRNLMCGGSVRGTCHGDDLGYIFYSMFNYRAPKDSIEYKVTRLMMDVWTTFAETGNPNCKAISNLEFKPAASEYDIKCLNISEESQIIDLPELAKFKLWNSFYASGKL